jgi:hypothetical protein
MLLMLYGLDCTHMVTPMSNKTCLYDQYLSVLYTRLRMRPLTPAPLCGAARFLLIAIKPCALNLPYKSTQNRILWYYQPHFREKSTAQFYLLRVGSSEMHAKNAKEKRDKFAFLLSVQQTARRSRIIPDSRPMSLPQMAALLVNAHRATDDDPEERGDHGTLDKKSRTT